MPLRLEIRLPEGWKTVGWVFGGEPPGSLADNLPGGDRRIIMFGCRGEHSVIWHSRAGVDYEDATRQRTVYSLGEELLATLQPGQAYVTNIRLDTGHKFLVRWTHQTDDELRRAVDEGIDDLLGERPT